MAYIVPNTDIVLCRDVPLDSSYDHTVDFTGANAQWAYFYSKRYKVVSVNSYQRVMSGRLRIECTMEEAIQCNYLYFRNNNFEDKFIYAFITGWYYINNITTEISYEIDVFQTFWFDVRLLQTFVEREHSSTDLIGENTVPENLEFGEYFQQSFEAVLPSNSASGILFLTTFTETYDETTQTYSYAKFYGADLLVNGVYTCINIIYKRTANDAKQMLLRLPDEFRDGIIAAYMCPFNPESWSTFIESHPINKNYPPSCQGYTPKNKKLWCYPYNILRIHNDVNSADFRYENFSGAQCQFSFYETMIPEPVLMLVPYNYEGRTQLAYQYRLSTTNFPQIAVNSDVYKVYLAQNASSLRTGMIHTLSQGFLGAAVNGFGKALQGDIIGAALGAGSGVISTAQSVETTLAKLEDLERLPPQLNGTQSSMADYGVGAKQFYAERLTIKREYAEIIDGYFNMFGYATHRVKQPNITGRPYWNYVQTKGNTVDALGVPDPYLKEMNNAFNKGITFWHNPNNVGTYSLDNSPV